ncbi:hypothetical protein RCL1_003143 [Eukaryota sp. TZLM3-RCL]
MSILAIELGGTTTVLSFFTDGNVFSPSIVHEFPTTSPSEVFAQIINVCSSHKISKIGVASFGPIEINQSSPCFATITNTPKIPFQQFNLANSLKIFNVPIFVDTDVNAAARAEFNVRSVVQNHPITSLAYVTIGTGIGVGFCFSPSRPSLNFEGGHIFAPLHPNDVENNFEGVCPFHSKCIEGMANAASIAKRAGCEPRDLCNLPDDHEVFDVAAHYYAHLCLSICLLTRTDVIVIGGGVFKRQSLMPRVVKLFDKLLNGYLTDVKGTDLLQRPLLQHSGLVGAALLTM